MRKKLKRDTDFEVLQGNRPSAFHGTVAFERHNLVDVVMVSWSGSRGRPVAKPGLGAKSRWHSRNAGTAVAGVIWARLRRKEKGEFGEFGEFGEGALWRCRVGGGSSGKDEG